MANRKQVICDRAGMYSRIGKEQVTGSHLRQNIGVVTVVNLYDHIRLRGGMRNLFGLPCRVSDEEIIARGPYYHLFSLGFISFGRGPMVPRVHGGPFVDVVKMLPDYA